MKSDSHNVERDKDVGASSRRAFVKKASKVAATAPAVALLVSLKSTPLSAHVGYGPRPGGQL